jgi:hypothetical protein
MLRRTQEALCQDKEILASKPLHWSLFDGQYRHVETQRLSLRKETMAQASGKEQLRRKRRGAALLQSSAHRRAESRQTNARTSVTAGLVEAVNQYAVLAPFGLDSPSCRCHR